MVGDNRSNMPWITSMCHDSVQRCHDPLELRHNIFICVCMCRWYETLNHMCCDSLIYATTRSSEPWPIQMCCATHSYVYVCGMFAVCLRCRDVMRHLFRCAMCAITHWYTPWPMNICCATHSYVYVVQLIHMCMLCDSFICVGCATDSYV